MPSAWNDRNQAFRNGFVIRHGLHTGKNVNFLQLRGDGGGVLGGEPVKSPNPENPEGFYLAVALAKENGVDFILGTDPDSDRVGQGVLLLRDELEAGKGVVAGRTVTFRHGPGHLGLRPQAGAGGPEAGRGKASSLRAPADGH